VARALDRLRAADLARGLRLAGAVDRASKGLLREDAWAMLKRLGLGLMGRLDLQRYEVNHGY
jgi:hypothetical protein